MNQPNEGMRERYKEFNYHNDNEGGGRFVRFDEDMLISFIDQEIDLTLAKQRSEIVEIIKSMREPNLSVAREKGSEFTTPRMYRAYGRDDGFTEIISTITKDTKD